QKEIAFAHYLSYRLSLELSLGALNDDPTWKTFRDSNRDAESMPLAQLPSQGCVSNGISAVTGKAQEQPSVARRVGVGKGRAPGGPTALARKMRAPGAPSSVSACAVTEMPEIPEIVGLLKRLNDSQVLTESRGYSNFYSFSIARWATRLGSLVYRNSIANGCAKREIEAPHEGRVADLFVPAINTDVLLACLTLRDVTDLSQFERPAITDPDRIGGQVGREIEITPGSFPRDLASASIFAEALLFFVLVYFGAFAREAALSPRFPAPGTLFSAFSRSRLTLLVLLIALWSPFAASVAVATASRRLWLVFCSALILGAVISAHQVLQRKSYFGALNLRKRTERITDKSFGDSETSEPGPGTDG
ncbi:MAG: hypothetical protein ACLP6W_02235, partial [Bryobacteraceae bacterium]